MSIKDFEIISSLGKGSFGAVHKAKRKEDNQYYAIKKVPFVKLSSKEKEAALNEVRLIASINHPNIIAYKEAFFDGSTLCIVMEYCEEGDLLTRIDAHKRKGTCFTEQEIWRILIQMAKGLKALHDLKIVHRDIKCANVFLTKSYEAKLGDFNVSKIAKRGMLNTQTGTPYYASPEVWKDRPYDSKSDIWSMGIVIYELCALRPPFMAASMEQLYKKIIQGVYPSIPSKYSKDLNSLIKACLQLRPEARPTCESILSMEPISRKLTDTLRKPGSRRDMISTIKFDRNVKVMQKRLPKPTYIIRNNSLVTEEPKPVDGRSKSQDSLAKNYLRKPLCEIPEKKDEQKASPKLPCIEKAKEKAHCHANKENVNINRRHNENMMNQKQLIRNKNRAQYLINIRNRAVSNKRIIRAY